MKLAGIFAAIATPFDYQGDLYKVKVQHNVEKWNQTALAGYAVGTGAGEGALLSNEERIALWGMVAQHSTPGRVLIADITREGVRESVSLAQRAAELGYTFVFCGRSHAPGVQKLYYQAVADQSPVPVIIPGDSYAGHPNVVTGLCTSADRLWQSLQGGAPGAILSFASAAPYATVAIWEAHRTRETDAGLDWQARISHANHLVTEVYGVAGLKHAMDLNGYYGGPPRLPYSALGTDAKLQIEEAFRGLGG